MSAHQLKQLQTQRHAAEALYLNAKAKYVDVQREMEKHKKSLKNIDNEIGKLQRKVVVSEHALLRYFERVENNNLEDIKKKILPPDTEKMVMELGDGTYPVGIHKIKVKDNTIVTVLTDGNEN